jgi:probable F420-dependent oxidoreductase
MSAGEMRWGVSFPFLGVPWPQQRDWLAELADHGFTDLWAGESTAVDAFALLAMAADRAPSLRLGTGIVPVFTRTPGQLALGAATLAALAPGRFVLGVGSSSAGVVERWGGGSYSDPVRRVRDTVRFLRRAFTGERISEVFETFRVDGFRLPDPVVAPPIVVAALRPTMLGLAGREADGVVLTWVDEADVRSMLPHLGEPGGREVVTWITVCPSTDADRARAAARRLVANYLAVPGYAAAQQWLGRGDQLAEFWAAAAEGNRARAMAAVPDAVVDALVVHGPVGYCRERIAAFRDAGVTTPVLTVLPLDTDPRTAVRSFGRG